MRAGIAQLQLSPSDLNHFLACEHRTWLDLRRAHGEIELHRAPRPDAELIAQRGREHELAHLARLRAEGRTVVEAPEDTAAAMRAGVDVIYQATLQRDDWTGQADFLVRVEEPSALGAWSYEAYDAKLATHPKPYFIFQLLFYTEQIAHLQGRMPEHMWIVLGTNEVRAFRPADFSAYAKRVRGRFEGALGAFADGAEPTYPYPVEHCARCDWWAHCRDRRRADDHLSLVAFLSRSQAMRLEEAGIRTVGELAGSSEAVPRVNPATLAGLRRQARLQVASRGHDVPLHELLLPEPERGFARLPAPSPGDVFFDIEGDPYWGQEGLEYLLGSRTLDGYDALWAHSRDEERASFERWIDWVADRLERFPDLHIYHYNHYEPTAIKKLAARYATREHQVDELLRRQVFVDLYTVVRQAMRIGAESYSLKAVEVMYALQRDAEVTEAGGSMLAYQEYVAHQDASCLAAIEAYNADDCRSTQDLRDWLLGEKAAAERLYGVEIDALQAPAARAASPETVARQAEIEALEAALGETLPAALLQYHRREQRPEWWAFFDRLVRTPAELRDGDSEAIGGLTTADELPRETEGRSFIYPMRFPPQPHKISAGDYVDPERGRGVCVARTDDAAGLVWVKRAQSRADEPLPRALIPGGPLPTTTHQDALRALATSIRDGNAGWEAARAILERRTPRCSPPLGPGPVELPRLIDQVASLNGSALFIQGPPGSGKTYTGAHLIAGLLRRGQTVGVASTSHKAIHNLLDEVEHTGVSFRGLKKRTDNPDSVYTSAHVTSTARNADFPGDVDLIAGTSWLWTRPELREAVDVLFVDEAGQVALADALAMSGAARSVVFLGDPQQLAHVSQGTHPRGSGASVLEHLLGDRATIPPEEGVFLDRSWRMHPDVCAWVSRTMYDDRLTSVAGRERQRVDAPSALAGAGLRLLEVDHADNRQNAPEEAERIAAEIDRLLAGGTFTDVDGHTRALTLEDILVVAPFNAQVRCLRRHLPTGARVGTVDKFQGQQAPIVFFSMTSSSGEDVPRGMDFLFSRNRLNVAVSRAQAVAVVVCSPRLLWAPCNTVEQMALVNALCEFAEAAGATAS
jgi:uncharacterized protein